MLERHTTLLDVFTPDWSPQVQGNTVTQAARLGTALIHETQIQYSVFEVAA